MQAPANLSNPFPCSLQLEGIIPNDPAFLDECFSLHSGPPDLADRSSAMAEAAKTNMEIDHMVEATEKS